MSDGEQKTPQKKEYAQTKKFREQIKGNLEPGDNTKYLTLSRKLADLPRVDLKNPEEVRERINAYFDIQSEFDLKPTVAGFALALGVDRRRLYEIVNGHKMGGTGKWDLPRETLVLVKNSYQIMENMMENYMQNGKINPVTGIFLSKNHYGYQDVQQHTFEMSDSDKNYSADDIRKRYQIEGDYQQLSSDSADSE